MVFLNMNSQVDALYSPTENRWLQVMDAVVLYYILYSAEVTLANLYLLRIYLAKRQRQIGKQIELISFCWTIMTRSVSQ